LTKAEARNAVTPATAIDRAEGEKTILQVVRGERHWTDLRKLGIAIELEGPSCTWSDPHGLTVHPGVEDIAQGFLAHRGDPRALREWAFVLEAAGSVDLDQVERHPAGESVLEALWGASFGETVSDQVMKDLEELARRN
jgi:hypothetical protein